MDKQTAFTLRYWYDKYFNKKREYDVLVKEYQILKLKLSKLENN